MLLRRNSKKKSSTWTKSRLDLCFPLFYFWSILLFTFPVPLLHGNHGNSWLMVLLVWVLLKMKMTNQTQIQLSKSTVVNISCSLKMRFPYEMLLQGLIRTVTWLQTRGPWNKTFSIGSSTTSFAKVRGRVPDLTSFCGTLLQSTLIYTHVVTLQMSAKCPTKNLGTLRGHINHSS